MNYNDTNKLDRIEKALEALELLIDSKLKELNYRELIQMHDDLSHAYLYVLNFGNEPPSLTGAV